MHTGRTQKEEYIFAAKPINCLSLSPRRPLWSCMTDRGTPSSAARGPPSRRSSAWPHSGRPASPSERTLHRSEPASSSTTSTCSPFHFPHPPFASCLFFLLLKTPLTPPRQPADSFKSGSLQRASPAKNSLGPPCQNRDESKKEKKKKNQPKQQPVHTVRHAEES